MTENANSKPFISVIIPTLNEEKFLPRLLENLIHQTTTSFEVIHVDGQSEDKTVPLAAKLGEKLPSFQQIISPIRHVSHQRNLGAHTSQGKYLLFVDADTQLPTYFIEGLIYNLHKDPSDVFTTWSIPDSNKAGDKALITIINLGLEAARLIESPFANGVLMGSSRTAFVKIGGFDETVHYGEDEDFVKTGYRKHLSFKVYREPRFVYSFRRFRKEGTLPTFQQMAAKKIALITNGGQVKHLFKAKDYPMGGHVFAEDTLKTPLFTQVDAAIKQFTQKPKLKQFLRDLLTFEEIDKD